MFEFETFWIIPNPSWKKTKNCTTADSRRIRLKSMGAQINFSTGQRPNFAYPFQVADDAMQMDIHETLYPFYLIRLCWLKLNSQSFVWNVFYTSAIKNAFSFHKLPIIHFLVPLLQISRGLRIINGQDNMSCEKQES